MSLAGYEEPAEVQNEWCGRTRLCLVGVTSPGRSVSRAHECSRGRAVVPAGFGDPASATGRVVSDNRQVRLADVCRQTVFDRRFAMG